MSCFLVNANAHQSDETAIRQLLTNQTNAWNNGNIEDFMTGYWNSDSLVFIGKSGLKYGYNTTLDNYKKSYPDKRAMGLLQFNLLQLKSLSPEYYFVAGKWYLKREAGDVHGHFTLLLRKINNRWLIVWDHSS
jgi:ketosteroid isomerase-like protein